MAEGSGTVSKPKFTYNLNRKTFDRCFDEETREEIDSLVDIVGEVKEAVTLEDLKRNLRDAEGCITGWGSIPVTGEILEAAPRLKVIIHSAGSVKKYISSEVWDRGVRVASVANVNAIPVAEYNLGMILVNMKSVFAYQNEFREKGPKAWKRLPTVRGCYRSKVGIIGMGHIGRFILKLLQPFDFEILIFSRYFPDEEARKLKARKVSLEELLSTCDVVTLCASNVPRNRHMINRETLSLMKDGATFINTSRGALVDEEALIDELRIGRITAVLDVFQEEPPPKESLFYSLPNCIITPHIAGSASGETKRLGRQALE
ncbi:MAG: hydroxyacid dehydrogenase, partial [Candidatus Bathyarchaeota archaeon]|nr:hydroxyacid dehydrogenase [Candidatus Bathyarchaeota archaeon]